MYHKILFLFQIKTGYYILYTLKYSELSFTKYFHSKNEKKIISLLLVRIIYVCMYVIFFNWQIYVLGQRSRRSSTNY